MTDICNRRYTRSRPVSTRFRFCRAATIVATVLPAILIVLGVASAAALGWGGDATLAEWAGGIALTRIMFRLQWVWVLGVVGAGLGLVGLVVAGGRSAWWLLGLLPVVGLFVWRFGVSPDRPGVVDDQPAFISAAQGRAWVAEDDAVIGVQAGDQAYAIPLAVLRRTPVVVHTERERRVMVTWSERAQFASAAWLDRSVRGRDLQIVASPHGVLLLFNRRVGEFFDALTLRTSDGQPLTGWVQRLPVELTTWATWQESHPQSVVMQPRTPRSGSQPLPPRAAGHDAVVFIATDDPIIVPAIELDQTPANLAAGKSAALVFRQVDRTGLAPGRVVALDRQIEGTDLFPRFDVSSDRSRPKVGWIDADTGSGWTRSGECIDGPLKGKRLRPLIVVEGLPASAVRFWLR